MVTYNQTVVCSGEWQSLILLIATEVSCNEVSREMRKGRRGRTCASCQQLSLYGEKLVIKKLYISHYDKNCKQNAKVKAVSAGIVIHFVVIMCTSINK